MHRKFALLVFIFLVTCFTTNAQQVIGQFPSMDGGYEGQTVGTLASASIATGTQRSDWTTSSQSLGKIVTGDTVRTGSKSMYAYTSSTAKRWQSPTVPDAAITSATAYTVQFYS